MAARENLRLARNWQAVAVPAETSGRAYSPVSIRCDRVRTEQHWLRTIRYLPQLGVRMNPIPLPPKNLRFMADDDETFHKIGRNHVSQALTYCSPSTILDLGCGYGRMAYALRHLEWGGAYLGMDILARHIGWLQANFSPVDSRYQFRHLDIRNDRYNPEGQLTVHDLEFPPGFSPDLVLMLSVFTYMYEAEIEVYLRKLREAMHGGSTLYVSFFLLRARATPHGYSFEHPLNDHCRFHDPKDPLHAIAYEQEWLMALFQRNGFRCKDWRMGMQDIAVLACA